MKHLFYTKTISLFTFCLLSATSNAQVDRPERFNQPCPGSSSSVELQGNLLIDGSQAVEGEDYIALFDSDGFVIGNSGIESLSAADSGCPDPISFVNIKLFGDASAQNQNDPTCPDNWGANEGEVIQGLVFDGDQGLYYDAGFTYTYDSNDGITEIMPGAFCTPVDANVLPASLTAFRGQAAGPKHVRLNWDVAREENVSHYEVQRSRNGREWERIGEVTAAGDSDAALTYSYDDLNPVGFRQFYRLLMVDLDGSQEFSGIVITELSQTGERTVNTFPNPATPSSRLSIQLGGEWDDNAPISAKLMDMNGRQITGYTNLQAGTSSVALPTDIKQGLYLLRITQADRAYTHKISLN